MKPATLPLSCLPPAALEAAMRGGTESWGQWGSAEHHMLYVVDAVPSMRRRKCRCGCGRLKTHMVAANGVGLYWACEFSARRWAQRMNGRGG